jgi:small-conductance mechanosensitive channel
LLHISEWGAEFLSRWVRRVTIVGVTGYAVAGVGLQFNMYLTAYDTLLKLFALVVHICVVVAILEAREPVARRIRPRHTVTGPWAAILGRLAEIWHLIAVFYVMALWLVWAVELRNGYVRLIHFFIITAAIIILARVLGVVLLGALDKARALPSFASRVPGFEDRANAYYPILRSVVMILIFIMTIVALLEAWGLGILDWFQGNGLGGRALSALLLISVTVFLAVVVWEGVNAAIELHLTRLSESAQLARAGRLRTLLPMLRTALLATIILVVTLMTLDELGVNIAPLLAGAGVVGIAVGFGSQKLVQDLITGLFLLLENAMQVGDVVTLGGLSGTVEALSIRTIRLRALDGSVHIIPFSAVTTVTNQTRDYGYALLDVSVGLNEEPDRIVATLKAAADTMRKEPRWQNIVLEPLDVMGVERFVDMAWVMRVRMKTQPSSRWAVSRELNRRFKAIFDELGIESPITSNRALSNIPAPPAAPITTAEGSPA